jgi:alkylhydroperoxidase family enzyme
MSRFHIHDDLTAPEASGPVLRAATTAAGQLPNFLGVLAGSPAARIALAVAEHDGSEPGVAMHTRAARAVGLRFDEIALARACDSKHEREAALLRWVAALLAGGKPPMHLQEEAREAGWDDEELLEAMAAVALERFTAMVNVAGDVPVDGSVEQSRTLRAA